MYQSSRKKTNIHLKIISKNCIVLFQWTICTAPKVIATKQFKSEKEPEWFVPSVYMYIVQAIYLLVFLIFSLPLDTIYLRGKDTANKCALWHTSMVWKEKTNGATNERGKIKNEYWWGVGFFGAKFSCSEFSCEVQSSQISEGGIATPIHEAWNTRTLIILWITDA